MKVINFGTSKMMLIHHQNFYVIISLLNIYLEVRKINDQTCVLETITIP